MITSAPGSSAAIWAASVRAGRSWPSPMLAVRIRTRLTGRTLNAGVVMSTASGPLVERPVGRDVRVAERALRDARGRMRRAPPRRPRSSRWRACSPARPAPSACAGESRSGAAPAAAGRRACGRGSSPAPAASTITPESLRERGGGGRVLLGQGGVEQPDPVHRRCREERPEQDAVVVVRERERREAQREVLVEQRRRAAVAEAAGGVADRRRAGRREEHRAGAARSTAAVTPARWRAAEPPRRARSMRSSTAYRPAIEHDEDEQPRPAGPARDRGSSRRRR